MSDSLFDDASLSPNSKIDSFENSSIASKKEPLAYRMRPQTLSEYVGQEEVIGENSILRRAIERDLVSSIILYGPPGTGKTTLAYLISKHTKAAFTTLNAVLSGVQQIRDEIQKAVTIRKVQNKKTILFVDEVHRWNKAQQDALLPHVENGTIILIGATTQNPFFEVNQALLSRSRVFELKLLCNEDLEKILAIVFSDEKRGYGKFNIVLEDGVKECLIASSSGDARVLLNTLEFCVETSSPSWPMKEGDVIKVSLESLKAAIQKKHISYDKKGDYHYDVISAFIKSVRGGDANAALYYLALMCEGGEDPHFIFRRLLILSAEDIGLASPEAITIVTAAKDAFDMVGLPEGYYFLSFATLYLATCDKSNSVGGFFEALSYVKETHHEVPNHLKDASRDSALSHGKGYLYPHDYEGHWVNQQYLPDGAQDKVFYHPSNEGKEKETKMRLEGRKNKQG